MSVNISRELLRQRFQAQTDVEIDPHPRDWERYAKWLEKTSLKEINSDLAKENAFLQKKMQQAMDALEKGITGAYSGNRKRRQKVRGRQKAGSR